MQNRNDKVFMFLRKPATSHSLLSINISQKNVSSTFFPKHSAIESWKQAWKVESSSNVRGLLPWRFQICLYTRNFSVLSGYCTNRRGLVTLCYLLPQCARSKAPSTQERLCSSERLQAIPLTQQCTVLDPDQGLLPTLCCPSYYTAHQFCASIICSSNSDFAKHKYYDLKKTLWTEQIPNHIAKALRAVAPGQPRPVIHFHNEQKECWLILHVRTHSSHNWSQPISPDLG